jgi:hypothetical protein
MSYSELIQQYFERSTALQWYWTIYVLVIGGVVGFSTFRQRPELVTAILVAILYGGFAYKNWGAIEATAAEREAIRLAIQEFPADPAAEDPAPRPNAAEIQRVRQRLEPVIHAYDIPAAGRFHLACDALTILFIVVKEWRRRKPEALLKPASK